MSLLVDYCEHQAAKYACERWHYSECIPPIKNVNFGVWEDNEFIGAVVYSRSVTADIGSFLGLEQTECVELTRVALTNHNAPVSQIVTYSLKMLDEKEENIRAVVSYADPVQDHTGGIYQAMNWTYIGRTSPTTIRVDEDGNQVHTRTHNMAQANGYSTAEEYESLSKKKVPGKHKYVYAFTDEVERKLEPMSEPYP